MEKLKEIDVNLNFIDEVKDFWNASRKSKDGIFYVDAYHDPDNKSRSLQKYHSLLWSSRELPNKNFMKLKEGCGCYYLSWDKFRFGSDSILNIYVHHSNSKIRTIIEEIKRKRKDFAQFYENYLRESYTIAGSIIFPKNGVKNSINTVRGRILKDRFDLTLECIRRHYCQENSPMSDVMSANNDFFRLFVNFEEYTKFFFLDDLVEKGKIKFFLGTGNLDGTFYPKNIDEWNQLYEKQMDFLKLRKKRIADYLKN